MSRLGKQPIIIPQGVTVNLGEDNIVFNGPKGSISVFLIDGVNTEISDGMIKLTPLNNLTQTRMNWGTLWSHCVNAIEGITKGFTKVLEMEGIGFKVSMEGNVLVFKVGFSHLVRFSIPDGITVSLDKNVITVTGIDKQLVGQVAAKIRSIRKPEPYKGKGIKYSNEQIVRKAGKTAGK